MDILAWFKGKHAYDKYQISACKALAEVRRNCLKKYGDDPEILYEQEGKRLQYYIDAMNNQGGLDVHKHALARWQIYKALYPEYISDKPPKMVKEIWVEVGMED